MCLAALAVVCCCRYLEENVGALAVKLTAEELKELEEACPAHKVGMGLFLVGVT